MDETQPSRLSPMRTRVILGSICALALAAGGVTAAVVLADGHDPGPELGRQQPVASPEPVGDQASGDLPGEGTASPGPVDGEGDAGDGPGGSEGAPGDAPAIGVDRGDADAPAIRSLSVPATAECPNTRDAVPLDIRWSSPAAERAYLGLGVDDAKTLPTLEGLPGSGGTRELSYQCAAAAIRVTLTVEDAAGRVAHRTVEVVRRTP
ncbi:hypothetical protein [Homoserinibacter sp. YIM 151385]|uniref:hypothetical protein n=1 Tax=Homoserinibacter sp. YIM 151385 TaxID=2985506 RepID=UPI0022F075F7|nr:hypothetical protein [Homoserinibacter sp. YIM 151385]WBU39000.1 hypothetical protein OF852_05315 [Homoserinibacter sp. YIM 151385]